LPEGVIGGYNGGMSDQGREQENKGADDGSSDQGAPTFAWEFVNDEHPNSAPTISSRVVDGGPAVRRRGMPARYADSAPRVNPSRVNQDSKARNASKERRAAKSGQPTPTVLQTSGDFGNARGNYVRDQLNRALDRWWAFGELPPVALLRDGLLLLEAGGSATESQRTLLLRAALAYGRGIQTALRHQSDPDRVALVLVEALLDWSPPLSLRDVNPILKRDQDVRAAFVIELQRGLVLLTGEPKRRAQVVFDELMQVPIPSHGDQLPHTATLVTSTQRWLRQFILILLLLAFVGFVFWQQRQSTPDDMVEIPAGSYLLLSAEGLVVNSISIRLDAFFIDRFEVTNRAYRTCVEDGPCPWPVRSDSTTRANYFSDPAFNEYPVVNVTQQMAALYCSWQEKRLPSAGEWQVAASAAPATNQAFRFPWGQSFDPQRTNSESTHFGDTIVVGSFRPGGDSPTGAADMAGNVAEWTATLVPVAQAEQTQAPETEVTKIEAAMTQAVVKGGSYASPENALIVGAESYVKVGVATPELGFRCARSHLSGR
jgi:formylglycine-generating enzyme required for sulfatase activity